MRGLVAVAVREITDRRSVLVAAAVAALVPLLVPLLPNLSGLSAPDVRGTAAWVIALGLSWFLAASFGFSMVATDLSEGRFGFFFSRPVGALPIWVGKVVGNYLVVLMTELVVIVPVLMLPMTRSLLLALVDRNSMWDVLGLTVGVPFVLVLVANAVGVMWRARSVWSVVDLAAALFLAGLVWLALSPLYDLAPDAFSAGAAFVGASLVISLFVAGAVQTTAGRTDIQRGHRALSTALWSGMAVATLVVGGFSIWLFSASPDDLVAFDVTPAPSSDWIAVTGSVRWRFDYRPSFLINTATGQAQQVEVATRWYSEGVVFSGDGSRVVWFEPSGKQQWRLVCAELDGEDQVITKTRLFFDNVADLRLSDSGDRVAVLERKMISIFDLDREALLIAAPVDGDSWVKAAWFATNDAFRIYTAPRDGPDELESVITLLEIDVRARAVHESGTITRADENPAEIVSWLSNYPKVIIDRLRDRALVVQRVGEEWRWTLRDGRSGEVLTDIGVFKEHGWAQFLRDGRLVKFERDGDDIRLVLLSPEGEYLSDFQIGQSRRFKYGGEVAPGVLTVSVSQAGRDLPRHQGEWKAKVVDLDAGTLRDIEGAGRTTQEFAFGPAGGGKLFFDSKDRLVVWNPATGELRRVLDTKL